MKKWIIGAVIAVIAVLGFFIYRAVLVGNTAFQTQEEIVYIPTGADFSDVLYVMSPLLKDRTSFIQVAKCIGYADKVKAGKYIIKKGATNIDIVRTLRNRNTPVKLKFNNQERLEDFAGRIAAQIEPDSATLMRAFLNPNFLKENGFTDATALAMYIPNTYEFYWNTSAEEFVHRMGKEYKAFWNDSRRERADSLGLSPKQVSILASIVQKESYRVSERPTIAGVYLNRLRQRIPLQADPTVIYAIKETSGNYDTIIKRVYLKDLQIESPYNTYLHPGLPPSPICMPDISSIDAVLHPQQHDYIFFVADTARLGYHKFAKTLQEHNKNRDAYRKWLDRKTMNSKEKGEQ